MDTTISSAEEALHAQEYRLADIAVYPVGKKRALVHSKQTDAACFLHHTYLDLLNQCRAFHTLDEHLAAFCQKRQVEDERTRLGLRSKLQQLAQQGYLISREQVSALFQTPDEPTLPTRITSLCIPTCNRVETLQRGITSYLEHCQHFGRTLDFVVADDSQSSSTREAYKQMLRTLTKHYGVTIVYAGIEEKTAFARKLSKAGDIPEEVISWACIGDRNYGKGTYGANRNTLFLHTVGECIFSSDDDVICRAGISSDFQEGLILSSQANLQVQFYPDRSGSLDAWRPAKQDILALHEYWLGQDPKACGAPYSRDGLLAFEQADPALLQHLATQPGKVVLTEHGIVGDISCRTTEVLLPYEQLINSEEAYLSARASREVAQAVKQTTLTKASSSLLGMCIGGLDNRELLPPFSPVGRNEDNIFSTMLMKCFPDAYTVHLPLVLLHAPLEARPYSNPICDISIEAVLAGCINLFNPPQPTPRIPTELLNQLSQYLEHIGQLSTPSFERFARDLCWRGNAAAASLFDKLFHKHEKSCSASWKRDVEAYCTKVQQSMLQPMKQRMQGGPETAQRLIFQFAQILKWWPAMVETAKRLRAEGCRLAQPV